MPNNPSTISDGTTLLPTRCLRRAQQILADLIIVAYERSTNRPGNSLSLVRFQYAYDENNEGKFCTHYDALVKDHDLNENIPLTVTIGVNSYQQNWS